MKAKASITGAVKYDSNGRMIELSDEDKEDIIHWEAVANEAVTEAVEELYTKGISSVHADSKGIYEKNPEGEKTYISLKYLRECGNGRK